ncbi:flagellar protein FliT [Brevibacillus antibioticus]|uniref:Flagellar protein FliT n=1 Tax=Brevibacillus antibioticus TaxID=2570228 RepID=A0A4U2YDU6_9BACL|nr:flagellar protein FliT [Brevibacillus antibioticus]TKI58595.1 flagellar protein FliT [Brevibacillus antibioticus]
MEKTVEGLLENILATTIRLEQVVSVKDSEPDEWLALLEERENLISQLQKFKVDSESLSSTQKQQMEQIYEINQRLIPLIDVRKQGVQQQLNNVQRSKLAMNSYNEAGPNGYGAFFDRKK